jgi:hypothetical protein
VHPLAQLPELASDRRAAEEHMPLLVIRQEMCDVLAVAERWGVGSRYIAEHTPFVVTRDKVSVISGLDEGAFG